MRQTEVNSRPPKMAEILGFSAAIAWRRDASAQGVLADGKRFEPAVPQDLRRYFEKQDASGSVVVGFLARGNRKSVYTTCKHDSRKTTSCKHCALIMR